MDSPVVRSVQVSVQHPCVVRRRCLATESGNFFFSYLCKVRVMSIFLISGHQLLTRRDWEGVCIGSSTQDWEVRKKWSGRDCIPPFHPCCRKPALAPKVPWLIDRNWSWSYTNKYKYHIYSDSLFSRCGKPFRCRANSDSWCLPFLCSVTNTSHV